MINNSRKDLMFLQDNKIEYKKHYSKRSQAKTTILIAVLTALGVIFSIIDKQISFLIFPFLPTAKIGLANIVILIAILSFGFRESLIMTIMKSTLVSLIYGNIVAFVIGFTASLLALIAMWLVKKTLQDNISCVGISVAGGFAHIVGQLLVTYFIYSLGPVILIYGAFLIMLSLLTSIIVGLIANRLNIYLINIM